MAWQSEFDLCVGGVFCRYRRPLQRGISIAPGLAVGSGLNDSVSEAVGGVLRFVPPAFAKPARPRNPLSLAAQVLYKSPDAVRPGLPAGCCSVLRMEVR
jgi:hypothetical protein